MAEIPLVMVRLASMKKAVDGFMDVRWHVPVVICHRVCKNFLVNTPEILERTYVLFFKSILSLWPPRVGIKIFDGFLLQFKIDKLDSVDCPICASANFFTQGQVGSLELKRKLCCLWL